MQLSEQAKKDLARLVEYCLDADIYEDYIETLADGEHPGLSTFELGALNQAFLDEDEERIRYWAVQAAKCPDNLHAWALAYRLNKLLKAAE